MDDLQHETSSVAPAAAVSPSPEPVASAPASAATTDAGAATQTNVNEAGLVVPGAPASAPGPSVASMPVGDAPVVAKVEAVATHIEEITAPVRAEVLGAAHHAVGMAESFLQEIERHAREALKAADFEVHAALHGLATTFSEFRNGLLTFGRSAPAKLADEAKGLVERAKL